MRNLLRVRRIDVAPPSPAPPPPALPALPDLRDLPQWQYWLFAVLLCLSCGPSSGFWSGVAVGGPIAMLLGFGFWSGVAIVMLPVFVMVCAPLLRIAFVCQHRW